MQLLICSILCLHVIVLSPLTWISKFSFIISGFAWACNFVPPLCCQQTSSCIHLVCCLQLLLMVLLALMLLPSYLDILVYKQLDVFMDRRVHRHLIDCISSCTLNSVFDSTLLESIVPVLLRGRWKLVIPREITILMTSNLSVKNQNKLEGWLATYLCDWMWRLHNFHQEIGRLTAKTA